MGEMAPDTAAGVAHRLFFTPKKARVRPEEHAVLARGERFMFQLEDPSGRPSQVVGRVWGEGPTVLLAHGWGGHSGQMTTLVSAVVAAGFRAVAVDFPGHGESEGRLTSFVHFARAVEQTARLFQPFHGVIAHSLGSAGVTWAMANGLHVERVVFVAPATEFETMWAYFRAQVGISPAVWQRMTKRTEAWLQLPWDSFNPLKLTPSMRAPLLVMHDETDREVPFEQGERVAGHWPGATLHRTERLGHVRILHDPHTVATAVDFISQPGGPRLAAADFQPGDMVPIAQGIEAAARPVTAT